MSRVARYVVGLLSAGLLVPCTESEARREERAMAAAGPQRLQADGSVRRRDADRSTLDLRVEAATEGPLTNAHVRLGRVIARPGDEAFLVAPVDARVIRVAPIALGSAVGSGVALVEVAPVLTSAEAMALGVQTAELNGQLREAEQDLALREATAARVGTHI